MSFDEVEGVVAFLRWGIVHKSLQQKEVNSLLQVCYVQ